MAEHVPDDALTFHLNAKIEADLQAEVDRIAAEDSKPGAKVTRSQAVRVLLWEAVLARASRQGQAAQSVAVDPSVARRASRV